MKRKKCAFIIIIDEGTEWVLPLLIVVSSFQDQGCWSTWTCPCIHFVRLNIWWLLFCNVTARVFANRILKKMNLLETNQKIKRDISAHESLRKMLNLVIVCFNTIDCFANRLCQPRNFVYQQKKRPILSGCNQRIINVARVTVVGKHETDALGSAHRARVWARTRGPLQCHCAQYSEARIICQAYAHACRNFGCAIRSVDWSVVLNGAGLNG